MPVAKVDPKTLGIVQTMIGAVIFMFGFATKYFDLFVSVHSCIMFWGSLCFIISGALSAATVDYHHPNLVKSSLGVNLISAVTAIVAVILYSVDLAEMSKILSLDHGAVNISDPSVISFIGTFRILLVLSLLEVFMSIGALALIWKSRGSAEAAS